MQQQQQQPKNQAASVVKLMVSYGGRIQMRPHVTQLTYAGGDTKILTIDRNIKFVNIMVKVNALCNSNTQYRLKYQLPGQGLDVLVSLTDDEDVQNLMLEYDHIHRNSAEPGRIRLFLFPTQLCATTPTRQLNPDFLFGFDKLYDPNVESGF